jgi:hypothetical protein
VKPKESKISQKRIVALCVFFIASLIRGSKNSGKLANNILARNNSIESSKPFIRQQIHYLLILENSKIYIKIWIKIAATCFGPRTSSGSLQLSLAKVTLMLKQSVKLRRYVLRGGVAA